jgi:hypothetical protein
MTKAYSQQLSVYPGSNLILYVSTDAPQFHVEFYRQRITLEGPLNRFNDPDIYPGAFTADGNCAENWQYPSDNFEIPGDWVSGVYIAMFAELDKDGNPIDGQNLNRATADAIDSKAMFIVRAMPGNEKPILLKIPTATYQAYNYTGNGSTYRNQVIINGANVASLLRPGNGTGGITTFASAGTPYYQLDVYDPSSDRMKFVHLEAHFIHWIETNGYAGLVDYCTDFDLHFDDTMLNSYSLLVSAGHDEYWSEDMRNKVAAFVKLGGNVAFFSGNTCWKHITFLNDWQFSNDDTWHVLNLTTEDSFTGVSYFNANGRWDGLRQKIGYTLQHKDHWVLENVNDNVIGDFYNNDPDQPAGLIGYECDGAPSSMQNGLMVPDGPPTPANFLILGYALLDDSWQDIARSNVATMGIYTDNGNVFTAATVDWARVLDSGLAPGVEQITRNVFNRLGTTPVSETQLSYIDNIICADGFYTDDGQFRHAIIGTANGGIIEIFFNPQRGLGEAQIADLGGLIDLGCFYSSDDQYRHVIALLNNGDIHEIFFNPQTGSGDALLANIANAKRVCGFFTGDDNYRHAIVATAAGDVIEIFYNPEFGQGQAYVAKLDGIIDIGCFYSNDDNYRHIIVATADGNITEIYYHPQYGVSSTVIAVVQRVSRLSAFYASNNHYFKRRVQVLTDNFIYEIRYDPDKGLTKRVLFNSGSVIDIGGFTSTDDDVNHSIIAYSDNRIEEIYYES